MNFLENYRISGRYGWVPSRGAIGKIGNNKRVIQSEKSIRRSMVIEVMVDDPNGLTSFIVDSEKTMIN